MNAHPGSKFILLTGATGYIGGGVGAAAVGGEASRVVPGARPGPVGGPEEAPH